MINPNLSQPAGPPAMPAVPFKPKAKGKPKMKKAPDKGLPKLLPMSPPGSYQIPSMPRQ